MPKNVKIGGTGTAVKTAYLAYWLIHCYGQKGKMAFYHKQKKLQKYVHWFFPQN